MRPDWDEYYLGIAEAVSRRASCPRASVGAVIVSQSGGIVSTGYNGSPSGEADCFDVGCAMTHSTHDGLDHCVRTIHAEMNAILWAARTGANVYGCTLYVTRRPCDYCAKHIAQAGIVRIVVKGDK